MCAIEAGKRGRRVVVIDHARKPAEKIRISGGGRCNFTNVNTSPANFLSENPRFAISALTRYTPKDFVAAVDRHGIAYHEKTLGQLFCNGSSQQIIDMLLEECRRASVTIRTQTSLQLIEKRADKFHVQTPGGAYCADSFVVASGGLSIPKMGATGAGYDIARQFGITIVPTRPALAPLTFAASDAPAWRELAGVALPARVSSGRQSFREAILFTHRGLSGPAALQISSYWRPAAPVRIDMTPDVDASSVLLRAKANSPQQEAATTLATLLPRRLSQAVLQQQLNGAASARLGSLPDRSLQNLGRAVNAWILVPGGTEGYRVAEVTRGGVDTRELSSQTMESKKVKGLYFIGEVADVTGHLGGFNFQWAWASGFAAGQSV